MSPRLRNSVFGLVLGLVLAACGGAVTQAADPTSQVASSSGGSVGSSDEGVSQPAHPPPTAGESAPPDTAAADDATMAPDFTLALGEGGEFVLSAETKPVYLVFWAEW